MVHGTGSSRPSSRVWVTRLVLGMLSVLPVILTILYAIQILQNGSFGPIWGTPTLLDPSGGAKAHAAIPPSLMTPAAADRVPGVDAKEEDPRRHGVDVSAVRAGADPAGSRSSRNSSSVRGMQPAAATAATSGPTGGGADAGSVGDIDLGRIRRYAEALDPELMEESAPGESSGDDGWGA